MNNGFGYAVSRARTASRNEGLRSYMLGVYNYMTLALSLSGFVAFLAFKTGLTKVIAFSPLGIVVALAPIGISLYMSAKLMTARLETIKTLFVSYAATIGLSFSTIFLMFSGADIARAFFTTAATFGAMSIYGYTTKSDLSRFSSMITMAIFGLLIASLSNIFFKSSGMSMLISFVAVLLFTGLVAYDTQNIKQMYYNVSNNGDVATRVGIFGALKLYMDFITIFIHLLQFFALSKNRD
jgi:FtsH-binding integral membrane protein